jgi:hypothetical protein
VHMGDEGLLPDNLMLTAVARAFTGEVQMRSTQTEGLNQNQKKIQSLSAAEVWTTQDWGKLQVCIYIYVYVYLRICMYVCMYVYLCVYVYGFNNIYAYTCIYLYVYMKYGRPKTGRN